MSSVSDEQLPSDGGVSHRFTDNNDAGRVYLAPCRRRITARFDAAAAAAAAAQAS